MFTGMALFVIGYVMGVLVPPNKVDDVARSVMDGWKNRKQ